jgi:hypothetical protein
MDGMRQSRLSAGWFRWSLALSGAGALALACGSELPSDPAASDGAPGGDAAGDAGKADAGRSDATFASDASTADGADATPADGPYADASTDGADGAPVDAMANDSSSDGTTAYDATSDVTFSFDTGTTPDAGLTVDAACAQSTATAQAVPLDMYVLFDRSGSMNDIWPFPGDCDVGGTIPSKWCYAVNALSSYFSSNDATGNAAALQYFPISAGACSGSGYSSPASPTSSFRALPSTGFNSSLNGQAPEGSDTPLEGAIRGITGFTSNTANQRAGRKLIGVLITDGDPTGTCSNNITTLKNILSTHYTNTGIPTFVVGMTGATFANLESIAEGGGGPLHNDKVGSLTNACGTPGNTCRHWNANTGVGDTLTEALKQIQKSAVACTYAMPTTDAGIIDPNQVKVEYRPGGTGTPQTFNKVSSSANCGSAGGFYYDKNSSPTSLTLCPTSCSTVQADSKAKVDILLGCLGS